MVGKEYNRQIAFLQVWAIVLVCLGHSLFNPYATIYIHRWIYAFHMPLFMFLSGYLLVYACNSKNREIRDIEWFGQEQFLLKKAKRLLLPYFFVSTLVYVPKSLLSAYALRPVDLSFGAYVRMLLYPWDNVIKFFWFLPTLFIITILTVGLIKVVNIQQANRFAYGIVFVGLLFLKIFNPLEGVSFLNLEGVTGYWLFFWSGIIFFFFQENIERYFYLGKGWICALLGVVFSGLIYYFPDVSFPFVRVVYTFLGILFSLSISKLYFSYQFHWADHLFGSSYAIYLFSWFPLVGIQFVVQKFGLSWQLGLAIALTAQIYIPFLVYKLLLKIRQKGAWGKRIAVLLGQ